MTPHEEYDDYTAFARNFDRAMTLIVVVFVALMGGILL